MLAVILAAHATCLDPQGTRIDVSPDAIAIGKNRDAVDGDPAWNLERDWLRATYGVAAAETFVDWRSHREAEKTLRVTVALSFLNPVNFALNLALLKANQEETEDLREELEGLLCLGVGADAPEIAILPEAP